MDPALNPVREEQMPADKVTVVLKHDPDNPQEVSVREAESLARQGLVVQAVMPGRKAAPAAKESAK